jgi:hypothetical protein
MTADSALREYLDHLDARIRARSTPLPESAAQLCAAAPAECLAMIVAALAAVHSANLVQAIGDGLLENLLNEHAATLADRVAVLLRTNQRFRFAFASATLASVDPDLLNEWFEVLQEIGTSKQRERKRLWATPFQAE